MAGIGVWTATHGPAFGQQITAATERFREAAFVVQEPATGQYGVGIGGTLDPSGSGAGWPALAALPPLYPEWLGDRTFNETHRTRFPYVTGAMANGIATTELVMAMAQHGCLGFFGAGGLAFERVQTAVRELSATLGDALPWGANLIHSPNEPALEEAVADLFIRSGVRKVSAAAYMALTPAIVRYAYSGIYVDGNGAVQRPNAVFAKISRPETARHFLNPAPAAMVDSLVAQSLLTNTEGELAKRLPVAEDLTVESDSGGHTDNRPLGPLFSTIAGVRNEAVRANGYTRPIRLGAAGGIGTPQAVAAAFAMGAAYVLTGTVNEACVESGLSAEGKAMLATADIADVTMAPAADMFELGVELQVLKRGTMFAPRAKQLYQVYRAYPSLESIPADTARELEKNVLNMSLEDCWQSTRAFWMDRDPDQVAKAEADPRHRMALTFRSYLGLSSRWAIDGQADRQLDYQIWCGPAMGAFNRWTAGSFLAEPANRSAVQVAMNLMEGAASLTRAHQFRTYGVPVPADSFDYRPRPLQP